MVIGIAMQGVKNAAAYLWPGYMTHKAMHSGNVDACGKWIVYWCVLAFCTAAEFFADLFLFWLPCYRIMKIAFVIYLWHPQIRGAQWIYRQWLAPYLTNNAEQIDAKVEEAQKWLDERSTNWRDQAMIAVGKGALIALEKVQDLGSPRTHEMPSPRIPVAHLEESPEERSPESGGAKED